MSHYSDNINEERYQECSEVACCSTMTENLFNGDIGAVRGHVALPYRNVLTVIWFCPWCGTRLSHMEENIEFVEKMYNKDGQDEEDEE